MAKHVVGMVVVPLGNFVATISATLRGTYVATTNTRVMLRMAKHVVGMVVVPLGNFVATISATLRGRFAVTTSMFVLQDTTAVPVAVVKLRATSSRMEIYAPNYI
jgi:hypothetical protein